MAEITKEMMNKYEQRRMLDKSPEAIRRRALVKGIGTSTPSVRPRLDSVGMNKIIAGTGETRFLAEYDQPKLTSTSPTTGPRLGEQIKPIISEAQGFANTKIQQLRQAIQNNTPQPIQGPRMTKGQTELQEFRDFQTAEETKRVADGKTKVQAQIKADAAAGANAMKNMTKGSAKPLFGRNAFTQTTPKAGMRGSIATTAAEIATTALMQSPQFQQGMDYVTKGIAVNSMRLLDQFYPKGLLNKNGQPVYVSDDGKFILENKPQSETQTKKEEPKTFTFQDDPALAALIPDLPGPPVPQLSLGEQLQQERDTLGLTPMQQWAKNFGGLANKVKDDQSGFNEIQAYFQAQDTGNTPKDQLAINTTGLETLIGSDGIGESKPGKPESFRSEKMAGNRIFNLIKPVK